VPNDVIQYAVFTSVAANVAQAVPIPILVPDGFAFRVRYCEFRHHGLLNVDQDARQAISIVADQRAFTADPQFVGYAKFIAYSSWGTEISGAAGLMVVKTVQHIDVWDMDYRLVMRPTLHTLHIGAAQASTAVLAGELVPASEGQRNAIIALQGGAK